MNIDIRGHLDVPFFVGLHFHLLLPHSSPQNVRSSRHRAQVTFIGRPMFSTIVLMSIYGHLACTSLVCPPFHPRIFNVLPVDASSVRVCPGDIYPLESQWISEMPL